VQAYVEAHNIPISIDGDFGPGTETGVKEVQKAYGEPETGVVNETTWSLLIAHAKP
jgi:peptidoglycan hydrolase-like protein with peptidoglycan-binding domain